MSTGMIFQTTNRSARPAAPGRREALQDPLFFDRWNDGRDVGFRAFATAVFALAGIRELPEDQRWALYRAACTTNRKRLLSEVAQQSASSAAVNLIAKASWPRFTRSDWKLLLEAAQNARASRALASLERISVNLVRQIPNIPPDIWMPSVFSILNRLYVPIQKWRRLARSLEQADNERRIAIIASARRMRTIADFWDTYFGSAADNNISFPLAQQLRAHTELLEPLTTPKQLEDEGLRMQNCLARLAWSAFSSERIFFRLRKGPPATAELVRTRVGWKVGRILGPRNEPVKPSKVAKVSSELERLIAHLPTDAIALPIYPGERAVGDLSTWAGSAFDAREIARLEMALLKIRGRSRSWTDGAFVIIESKTGGFVQFMSNADGSEYLCEILSHKYQPAIARFLTAEAVDVIESSGFQWPRGVHNFRRMFRVTSPGDCRTLAQLALALLSRVYRHRSGEELTLKVHTVKDAIEGYGPTLTETDIVSVIAEECALAPTRPDEHRRHFNGSCHDAD